LLSRAFLEVWNLRTDKVVGKPKGLLLPKAKVLSVAIEKGSKNFKINFHSVLKIDYNKTTLGQFP
jgi:hypothetical protein